ncbi:MAG TPA: HigA family addiction module antitoxin [Stellaceae bacterium]|jgi:addiction module HigA family antidote|nr:HigA family addiction module antitoxin [Stellaceae bacterium]
MTEYRVRRPLKRPPSHPGELMREVLVEHLHLPLAQAARRMGVTRTALYAVLGGKHGLTAEMALRYGKLIGAPVDAYLSMQTNYDLWHAEQRLADSLKKIATVKQAA